MQKTTLTFEEVDRRVQAIDTRQQAGDPIKEFCRLWPVGKTILEFLKQVLPDPWKKVVDALIAAGDKVCSDAR